MITRPPILPGDLVVHEYDAPIGHCVRLVTAVHRGHVDTIYIAQREKLRAKHKASHDMLARVRDFGVTVINLDADTGFDQQPYTLRFLIHVDAVSTATYADGQPRRWQTKFSTNIICRPPVFRRWRNLCGVTA
jgi:hypothetical protein